MTSSRLTRHVITERYDAEICAFELIASGHVAPVASHVNVCSSSVR